MTLRPRCDGCQARSQVCLYCIASFFSPAEAQRRPYYADYSPVRKYIHTLCTSHYLDLFITFIIGVNVITMSMEHYNQPKVRAPHRRAGCETQRWGVAEHLRTIRSSLGFPLASEVCSQPCFPGSVPRCLKPSAWQSIWLQASSAVQESLVPAKSLISLLFPKKAENKVNGE